MLALYFTMWACFDQTIVEPTKEWTKFEQNWYIYSVLDMTYQYTITVLKLYEKLKNCQHTVFIRGWKKQDWSCRDPRELVIHSVTCDPWPVTCDPQPVTCDLCKRNLPTKMCLGCCASLGWCGFLCKYCNIFHSEKRLAVTLACVYLCNLLDLPSKLGSGIYVITQNFFFYERLIIKSLLDCISHTHPKDSSPW